MFGVLSIALGLVLLVTTFPVGIVPAAVLIGGGARLIWGVGTL